MNTKIILFISILLASTVFLASKTNESDKSEPAIEMMASPAGLRSSKPFLHTGIDGNIYLTWIETSPNKPATLYYSTIKNNKWSSPSQVADGENWFINWADFPSITSFGKGLLASHFLVKSEKKGYAYDINLRISKDGGITWGKAFAPHDDNTKTEHGFVSMLPYPNEQFLTIWLDGRKYAQKEGESKEMTLRAAIIDKNGEISKEYLLDERVCDCCGTDAAITSNSTLVVYRNRTKNELRDISIIRFVDKKWTSPKLLFKDDWKIAGCPVNGPAISAKENLVAVAWFSAANDKSEVKVVFSSDEGKTFGKAIKINETETLGRVDIALLDDGAALVTWLETSKKGTAIKCRKVEKNGNLSETFVISESSKSRATGFPKMTIKNSIVYLAWTTQLGETLSLKTAFLNLKNSTIK